MNVLPIHPASRLLLGVCLLSLCGGSLRSISAQGARPQNTSGGRLVLAASEERTYTREADFGPDGQFVLDMNVADISFHRGEPGKLKLEIDPRGTASVDDASSWVREFAVSPQHAKLQLEMPKHSGGGNSPHVDVYLPEQSSVKLDVGVGNVDMAALAGSIDLTIGVGNVNVHALDRDRYHDVEATVSMGNISDEVFGMHPSGMLSKEASFHGDGPWKIRLHAKIGNIDIHTKSASEHGD